jgi:hypothetical protein
MEVREPVVMKFHIEIIHADDVVYRTTVDEMNPYRAKDKAVALLNVYALRGANKARVLNSRNDELFVL